MNGRVNRMSMGIASLAILCGVWAGCTPSAPIAPKADGTLDVCCSFFPIYLFTKEIVGDRPNVKVTLMVPAELGCPHDYDLTPDDVKKLTVADLFVMNGAGLEEFSQEQITRVNPKIQLVDTSTGIELLGAGEGQHADHDHGSTEKSKHDHDHAHDHGHEKAVAKKSGDAHDDHDHAHDHPVAAKSPKADAKHDHDHDHGHAHDHGHGHDHAGGNPHFFSSPRQAAIQVHNIAQALAKADPAGAASYRARAEDLESRLQALADEFAKAAKEFPNARIVTVHEVFDYLARDAGLTVVATIQPTGGTDPTTTQIKQVIDKIRESNAKVIFTEPQYPRQTAESIGKDLGIAVRDLDPIASGPSDAPTGYYEQKMKDNLAALKSALGTSSP